MTVCMMYVSMYDCMYVCIGCTCLVAVDTCPIVLSSFVCKSGLFVCQVEAVRRQELVHILYVIITTDQLYLYVMAYYSSSNDSICL